MTKMPTATFYAELGKRLERIRTAKEDLAGAQKTLAAFNKHGLLTHSNGVVSLNLANGDQYGNGRTTIYVAIPKGVIQEILVQRVNQAQREYGFAVDDAEHFRRVNQ